MIVYGPVPSRRLGQSIGINNIPPKRCTYSCVYCQIGRTNRMQLKREEFYKPEEVCAEVEAKLKQLKSEGRQTDYLSFVPDGEPTLDLNLGKTIQSLKAYNIKIAVITNASLLWMKEVKEDLMGADWVSVSIDAVDETTWRKIDRPHGKLVHQDILNGILEFSQEFPGTLVTETMLVEGMNDQEDCVERIAEQVALVQPQTAYILVPSRPPAESKVKRASIESLRKAVAILRGVSGANVECITGDEEEEGFFFTEDIAEDIQSIASVHPIREDILESLLKKRNTDRRILSELIDRGDMIVYSYEGKKFYKRNLHK